MKRKTTISITILGMIAIVGIMGLNQGILAENLVGSEIEYSASMSDRQIIMNPGETRVIPINVAYPQEKSLHVKVGVTTQHNESFFIATGIDNLPSGITATLDKKIMDLPATTSKGFAERDTNSLSLSVSKDVKPGLYDLSVVLFEDNGQSSFRYITVEVK